MTAVPSRTYGTVTANPAPGQQSGLVREGERGVDMQKRPGRDAGCGSPTIGVRAAQRLLLVAAGDVIALRVQPARPQRVEQFLKQAFLIRRRKVVQRLERERRVVPGAERAAEVVVAHEPDIAPGILRFQPREHGAGEIDAGDREGGETGKERWQFQPVPQPMSRSDAVPSSK